MSARLEAQIAFLREADRLKSILRASWLLDASRHENSAEHSWHIMLYALVLADQAAPDVQIDRVLRMLLIHDIVEIDAGDAPIHGSVDHAAMAAREADAADRLFGLLPPDLARDFRALRDEFEAAESADARFAKAIDRVQTPIAIWPMAAAPGPSTASRWTSSTPASASRSPGARRASGPGSSPSSPRSSRALPEITDVAGLGALPPSFGLPRGIYNHKEAGAVPSFLCGRKYRGVWGSAPRRSARAPRLSRLER